MKRTVAWLTLAFLLAANFAVAAESTEIAALRKAAEAGDAKEQFLLGLMYAIGEGVPKDSAESVKWYRKAADQGLASAQTNLGYMYINGDGVPKDLVQAHVWWNIAGAKGQEEAKKNLAILEKQMTADQKAEAMKLARELFAKIEANKDKAEK